MTPAIPAAAIEAAEAAARGSVGLDARPPRGVALVIARGWIVAAAASSDPGATGVGGCAERAAVQEAIAAAPVRPGASSPRSECRRSLAIRHVVVRGGVRGRSNGGPPCGACLQVLAEFAPRARVHWGTTRAPRGGMRVCDLLPGAFGPSHLGAGTTEGRPSARARTR